MRYGAVSISPGLGLRRISSWWGSAHLSILRLNRVLQASRRGRLSAASLAHCHCRELYEDYESVKAVEKFQMRLNTSRKVKSCQNFILGRDQVQKSATRYRGIIARLSDQASASHAHLFKLCYLRSRHCTAGAEAAESRGAVFSASYCVAVERDSLLEEFIGSAVCLKSDIIEGHL